MTKILPLVSVIVPNYNHEKYLVQRLDSIFKQTYLNFEVILLDDCSIDNSQQILLKYAKNAKVCHCLFNEKNSGNTFIQWNKGISLAKGEYIWIAESDDFCSQDFLEKVMQPLLKNKDIVLSYCQSNRVNEDGEVTGNWKTFTDFFSVQQFDNDFVLEGNLFIENYLICKNVIPNASAVILKKDELNINDNLTVNNQFKYCGDWVIYLSQIINKKVAFNSKKYNNFRYHTSSVIARASKNERRNSIIDIDIEMRKLMLSILKNKEPINYQEIVLNNKKIIKSLKYEKVVFLFHNHQKLKALFLLIGVLGEFFRRYSFKKNLMLKIKKNFS